MSRHSLSAVSSVRAKLGACPRCMRVALALCVSAWVLVIAFPSAFVFAAAIVFTVPALAHLVAFGVKRSARGSAAARSGGCCGENEAKLGRRTLLNGFAAALLGLWAAGTAKVPRALAQIQGRTVTVEVKDQNGKPCAGVTVVLADACVFIPATLHRRPMCRSVNRKHASTDRHGKATFSAVVPGQYEICICGGYDCVLNATATGCDVKCRGPKGTIAVPPAPAPVPPQTFVLTDCKC